MNAGKKARSILGSLKLDKHHAINRMAFMVVMLLVTLMMIIAGGLAAMTKKHSEQMTNKAIYTTKFTTSKTKINGTMTNVYASKDHTKILVLMKFDDNTTISTNAKNYQSFVTAVDTKGKLKPLKSRPSGSIYSFGTTGYMGIYMVNAKGFPSQIMSVTLRANSELVPSSKVVDEMQGTSFAEHDQWRIYFNPGASEATPMKALDSATPDPTAMFAESVIAPQEAEVRSKLDQDLVLLKADLAKIAEYTQRLRDNKVDGKFVVAPSVANGTLPVMIAGDKVTGTASPTDDISKSTLMLKTEHTIPNGYNFDWRNGSVTKGYLSGLVPAGTSPIDWINAHEGQSAAGLTMPDAEAWTMSDGTKLSDLAAVTGSNSALGAIMQNVALLSTVYQTYYTDKTTYQSIDMRKLLNLEMSITDVQENHTVNANAEAFKLY